METIGEARGGGKLVQMTAEEHDEFRRLENVVNGQVIFTDPVFRSTLGLNTDLGPTFAAVRAFAEAKFRLNEMQDALDQLRSVLDGSEETEV